MPTDNPYCFAKLENVFPMGDDGLRHTPESCSVCRCKTACLRAAVKSAEGVTVKMECVDRAYHAGMIGFVSRWSRRKALSRKKTPGDE
ncbi:MAG: hypothetical protein ABIL58_23915 [Pseudomonadota bacterium]